eukprot:CAMPEP_0181190124 /NCGR_PEP_ID=MMETSP1096-20121128/12022_1 /TAXON_ID=156174 ORGANISM="Chrysochromulina ericina, Strain CCMP281" /NCGR_SAMPLE_ID=MMETSP1096 /ASSEMBLY_ACC=CAM_ASM_000453 /LENGTH=88 /DNA_ID=CAMNT_0023279311 /DNA_START=324 /DNA_END=590 /DNA_ORIENTATION=+
MPAPMPATLGPNALALMGICTSQMGMVTHRYETAARRCVRAGHRGLTMLQPPGVHSVYTTADRASKGSGHPPPATSRALGDRAQAGRQ